MKMPRTLRWIGLVCVAAAAGCAEPVDSPKHLVLIVVDTLRADAVGCYGGDAETPNIDRLAAEGVRFDQARSHIPITGPSHLSLFTSLPPNQHGVHNNAQVVPDDAEPLAELLSESGFGTTGIVSLGVLDSKFGFSRGFDIFDDQILDRYWRDAAEVNEVVLPLLDAKTRMRRFFWIHYSDPHSPYAAPDADLPAADVFLDNAFVAQVRLDGRGFSIPVALPPGETVLEFRPGRDDTSRRVILRRYRFQGSDARIEVRGGRDLGATRLTGTVIYGRTPVGVALVNPSDDVITGEFEGKIEFTPERKALPRFYRDEVEFVDRQIGRLIDKLRSVGIWEDSLVVFIADHGEGLGFSGRFAHVEHLYEDTLRVPLILVSPGRMAPGTVVTSSVRLIDVLPTMMEVLGLTPPRGISGESLVPLINGSGPDRPLVAMTYGPQAKHDRRALVADGFKYIWTIEGDGRELFDLASDPGELINLVDEDPSRADTMHERLLRGLAETDSDGFAPPVDLSEDEKEALEALGYVH